ncbi:kinase domain protein [Ceratobasidium sp. AG-Ba]|nr:kinase domain protein [Ceratobasidium sp. AG-Ba]
MADRRIITVTRDAEIYHVVNITECSDAESIHRRIFSQLQIPLVSQPHFEIYRTELGGVAIGNALDSNRFLNICQELGDGIGSLKFIVQDTRRSSNTPITLATFDSLQNDFWAQDNLSDSTGSPLHRTDMSGDEAMLFQPGSHNPTLIAPGVELGNTLKETRSPNALLGGQINSKMDSQTGIKWARGSLIGRSMYSRVYHALNISTGEIMAVKQVDLPQSDRDREDSKQAFIVQALKNECSVLRRLTHPNIIRFLGSERTLDTLSMFLEYIPGDHLGKLLKDTGKLEDKTVRFITRQIVDGLAYLHVSGVIHCNLKCSNVLVSDFGLCRIFGFSVSEQKENTHEDYRGIRMQGSIYWMAPEMIHDENQFYDPKVDIWSLGCTTTEMQTAQRPWLGENAITVLYKVGVDKEAPPISDTISLTSLGLDFRRQCFRADPAQRSTAAELLHHPWLANSDSPGRTFRGFKAMCDPPGSLEKSPHDSKKDTSFNMTIAQSNTSCLAMPHRPNVSDGQDFIPHSNPSVEIRSTMSSAEIIRHLVSHGCKDQTMDLDLSSCSEYPISSGGSGDVYRGKLKIGHNIAIKCMRFVDLSSDENKIRKDLKYAAREIYTWSRLSHPNVLRLLGLVEYRGQIGMLSLWMDRGAIRDYLAQNTSADRLKLCAQITDGLSYLHEHGVVHGDLKGDNVLISDAGEPLLTDFGNAVLQEQTLRFTYTTDQLNLSLRWAAPELFDESGSHSVWADIFALGMTILEVITGNVPYAELKDVAVTLAIMQHRLPKRPERQIPTRSKYGNFIWLLLNCCWNPDPNKRPTAVQILQHLRLVQQRDLVSY